MIRIAVVEDDPVCAGQLERWLERYAGEKGQNFQIRKFSDGAQITARYRPEYELILMDIEMPGVDGLSAARMIREQDEKVGLLFITNSAGYAVKSYSVNAMDYLLKPLSYPMFSHCLTRALARIRKEEADYLVLTQRGDLLKMDISDLLYIESQNHNLIFHLLRGERTIRGKIGQMEEQLCRRHFFRCHAGYLINLRYVEGYQDGCVRVGQDLLPVSRAKKKEFLAAIMEEMNGV